MLVGLDKTPVAMTATMGAGCSTRTVPMALTAEPMPLGWPNWKALAGLSPDSGRG